MRRILGLFVKGYRFFVSPWFAPKCRFHPTCSAYALEALKAHGFFKGSFLSLKRLLRCHPWGEMGQDPVPTNPNHSTKQ